jgi:hypothetical protein
MGKTKHYIGEKINDLTIVGRDMTKPSGNGHHISWLCECSCGKIISVESHKLSQRKDCGHSRNTRKNIIGKTYDDLTVIGFSENTDLAGNSKVICQCKCGNIVERSRNSLFGKKFHTCENCKLKIGTFKGLTEEEVNERIGQKFGRLTILERTDEYTTGGSERLWLCKCDCGNYKKVRYSTLKEGRVSSCGCLVSKGEMKILSILQEHNIPYKEQFSFSDLKSNHNKKLKFDFAIFNDDNELQCLIEYQGIQHYDSSMKYYDEAAQERDNLKREYCKRNNIKLVEIPYTDFDILTYNYLLERL